MTNTTKPVATDTDLATWPVEDMEISLDGFERMYHPTWVIQMLHEDPFCGGEWFDADHSWYKGDADLKGDVGGINFRPLYLYPTDLKQILDLLRQAHPEKKWRMVMRLQVEKALDI